MQDAPKAVWSIQYVYVAFSPSLKNNFIEYRSSNVSSRPDYIFKIHQFWQSGFSRVYSNGYCSCSFEPEIIKKIGQWSHKMYSNKILNFQESMPILNSCKKKRLETYWIHHVIIFFWTMFTASFLYIFEILVYVLFPLCLSHFLYIYQLLIDMPTFSNDLHSWLLLVVQVVSIICMIIFN